MNKEEANELLKTSLMKISFPIGIVEVCKFQIDNEPRFVTVYAHMTTDLARYEIETNADGYCLSFFANMEQDTWYRSTFDEINQVIQALRIINNYNEENNKL